MDRALEAVATHVTPSVVTVVVTQKVKPRQMPQGMMPFFGPFMGPGGPGQQQQQEQPQYARDSGSGFIISPDGYIVTNHHVVGDTKNVEVILSNGEQKDGKVVGTDPLTDLAVIKIPGTGYPALPWGDSAQLHPGQMVMAFGTPFGLFRSTVTKGIVSGIGRPSLDSNRYRPGEYIQTDAAINPGNSGGPLVDVRGRVVGINTMIVSPNDAFAGVGFAIPVEIAQPTVAQLIAHGKVEHGYLGVGISDVTPENAHFFNMTRPHGTVVTQVTPGAPGDSAGLKVGDVITAINGKPIETSSDLQVRVEQTAPNTKINVQVNRNGKMMTLPVTVAALPGSAVNSGTIAEGGESGAGAHLGIDAQDLTPALRDQLHIPPTVSGAIIAGVQPGGPADNAGISRGMIIEQVNRKPVTSVADLRKLMASVPAHQDVLLLVWTGGGSSFIVIHPTQPVQ